ncbi:hypothetical protein J3R74_003266 [Puniceicoccus vermicola]
MPFSASLLKCLIIPIRGQDLDPNINNKLFPGIIGSAFISPIGPDSVRFRIELPWVFPYARLSEV